MDYLDNDISKYLILRKLMIGQQIRSRGIYDDRVLEVMLHTPREEFVLFEDRNAAYNDRPLSIGHGQTISQPYIVAKMSELLR